MSVLSVFEVFVTPESVDQVPDLLGLTLAGTRSRKGCLGVEVAIDVEDPTHFVLFERWETLADDDAYRAWRATPEGAPAFGHLLAGPPSLTRAELRDDI